MTTRSKKQIAKQATNRAAIYLRVSTEDQALEGYGLDVQLERCTAQAIANGLAVTGVYKDAGISGTKDASERQGLADLLKAVENREIDNLIVLALDRLGRKTRIVLDIVERVTKAGVNFISVKEQINTETSTGQFVLTIFAALAELERNNIVERTTNGRDARGKIDGEKGGRVHFGYERTSKGIVVRKAESAIVKRIFDLHKQKLTLRAIAEKLTADGITPPKGKAWYASGIKSILDHEADYRGGKRGDSAKKWPVILTK